MRKRVFLTHRQMLSMRREVYAVLRERQLYRADREGLKRAMQSGMRMARYIAGPGVDPEFCHWFMGELS